MGTEALKMMKEQLMSCVQGQLGDISKVDAKELGEAVDMIKDLAEAIYYCTITESMEKSEEIKNQGGGQTNINYYTTPAPNYNRMYYPDWNYRDMERTSGYMYYNGGGNTSSGGMNSNGSSGSNSGNTSYYTQMPYEMRRDPREGRAALRRKMYMEGKEVNRDKNSQLKELEAYLQELSSDIAEMIKDASPEERTTLHQKMTMLANKIV